MPSTETARVKRNSKPVGYQIINETHVSDLEQARASQGSLIINLDMRCKRNLVPEGLARYIRIMAFRGQAS